jgi:hypothetical protein
MLCTKYCEDDHMEDEIGGKQSTPWKMRVLYGEIVLK